MMSPMTLEARIEEQEPGGESDTARGALAAACDAALARAVGATVGEGWSFTSVELHVHYVRPLEPETGRLRCIVDGVRVGKRTATAVARVLDADGEVYAHALMTCLLHGPPLIPAEKRRARQGGHS